MNNALYKPLKILRVISELFKKSSRRQKNLQAKYSNIGTFRKELNNAKGNIWILEVVIPKRECIYKIVGNTNAGKAIAKAFDKFIAKLELNPSNVSWMCSSQFNMEESRLYFLFYEKEPTFFNQGTNEYAYRKGRVDLDILAYFKAELLRGIKESGCDWVREDGKVYLYTTCNNPFKLAREVIKNANNKKIISFDNELKNIKVYTNKNNIDKLKANYENIINLLKATSIVGYISVMDLTKMGDVIRSATFEAFFPLFAVALIYFGITAILLTIMRFIQKKLAKKRQVAKK